MFGLLKTKRLTKNQYADFRLNYCGTCKTIGKIYGHKERLLLNYDVVFLSELLHSLNYKPDLFNSITPFSCFKLPKQLEEIPKFLRYTAAVNVILGYYKLMDNDIDSSHKFNIWRLLKYSLHSKYLKAKKTLEGLGLEVSIVEGQIQEQFKRESNKFLPENFNELIEYYSNPTGIITGSIFAAAVLDLADIKLIDKMHLLGENFGKIVYLIDAIEDCEKDRIQNKFNILLLDTKLDKAKALEEIKLAIYNCLGSIEKMIDALPISIEQKKLFVSRFFLNVNEKLSNYQIQKIELYNFKPSINERFNLAIEASKQKTLNKSNVVLRYAAFVSVAAILVVLFLLFPSSIHQNKGYVEANCCGSCGGCCDNCCRNCSIECCGNCSKSDPDCSRGCDCDCRKLGEGEGEICNFGTCLTAIICFPCACRLCSGGSSGGGTKIITITKIIPVDKGCGGCG